MSKLCILINDFNSYIAKSLNLVFYDKTAKILFINLIIN